MDILITREGLKCIKGYDELIDHTKGVIIEAKDMNIHSHGGNAIYSYEIAPRKENLLYPKDSVFNHLKHKRTCAKNRRKRNLKRKRKWI